ncbi:MAG: beta-N-acetylhexosaminidase [Bacteroidales bacterium]
MRKSFLSLLLFVASVTGLHARSAKDVVIPVPNSVQMTQGSLAINGEIEVKTKGKTNQKNYLMTELNKRFGIKQKKGATPVFLTLDASYSAGEEAYTLSIKSNGIEIKSSSDKGLFYGVQSLLQLINAEKGKSAISLSCQVVEDAPRFAWRSYLLDESRYFLGVEELKRLVDALADLKINVLHWHLTDDAGWRIESKKYPLLTEIGSKRKDTEIGTWGSGKTSGEPHEGFYTQKEVKDILRYCRERQIKVVPEIEMPGHASAAIASYPWLGTKNEKIEVPVLFGKHYAIFNVIDPKVQKFLKDVVAEVIDLFDADVIHIGGDEVRFDHWEQDANMVAHKEKMGYSSFMDIQIEFVNMMSEFIKSKGARMMGWNEILGKDLHPGEISFDKPKTEIAENVMVQFWKGDVKDMTAAARKGYQLVNSYHADTYLDYSYGSIPLKRIYAFNPIPGNLEKEYHKNIVGAGCQMWREWVPTVEKLQVMSFPRVAGFAEAVWSREDNKNYDAFLQRLPFVKEMWKANGIKFYEEL